MTTRTLPASRPQSPPAIWAAFAAQGRWKNWVMAVQLLALFCMMLLCLAVARTEPNVVVVGPEGEGTYVERSLANQALLHFLSEQRGLPSDLTVTAFTKRFVSLALAPNSSTIEEAWPAALSLMAPTLREKLAKEGTSQKLLETYRLAQIRTQLAIREIVIVERAGKLVHVRGLVDRTKSRLVDGSMPTADSLQVDLVLRVIARSVDRPDGLEISEWKVAEAKDGTPAQGGPTP